MKHPRHHLLTILILAQLLALPAPADDLLDPQPELPPDLEEFEWREQAETPLPPYPDDDDLVAVDIPQLSPRLSYAVDIENLAVGGDGIVRYTVVIESTSGARNVFFEGLDCREGRFKTYGYGHAGGKLSEKKNPRWQRIPTRGSRSFRHELRQAYFCERFGYARPVEEIRKRLRGHHTLDI